MNINGVKFGHIEESVAIAALFRAKRTYDHEARAAIVEDYANGCRMNAATCQRLIDAMESGAESCSATDAADSGS